jgi:hypothetical protein
MRYLKTFENLGQFTGGVKQIETFIKNNLAYILDEGFTYKVNFKFYGGRMNYIVKIHKIEQKGNNRRQLFFRWENIKDDFIPFLELLNENYTLDSYSPEDNSLVIDSGDTLVFVGAYVSTPGKQWIGNKKRWYNIEELINDSVDDNDKFQFISFVITGEK